jgi:cytochrome c-type biogenesis protein CcmF
MQLIRTTPAAFWGLAIAHAGLGVTTIGVTAVSAFQTSQVVSMGQGQSVGLAGDEVTLLSVKRVDGPNYEANQARFSVANAGGTRFLTSERRFYPASQTQTTQAAIGVGLRANTYISIGDQDGSGRIVVRLWNHPFVSWIWAGGLIMAFGGGLSLSDRRLRLGVGRRAQALVADTEVSPA